MIYGINRNNYWNIIIKLKIVVTCVKSSIHVVKDKDKVWKMMIDNENKNIYVLRVV